MFALTKNLLSGMIAPAIVAFGLAASPAQAAVDITYSVLADSDINNVINFEAFPGGSGRGGIEGGRTLIAGDPTLATFSVFDIPTPASVFFAGTSDYFNPVDSFRTASLVAIETHLILSVNTAFALTATGSDFSELFDGVTEGDVIAALQCVAANDCAAREIDGDAVLGDFQNAVLSAGAAISVPGPTALPTNFALLTFSTALPFGSGTLDAIPSAVPEPASWALMIGGFGMAGAALRRRSPAMLAA